MSVPAFASSAVVLEQNGRWLVARFAEEHHVASWAVVGGGLRRARAVVWYQVSNDELRPPVNPAVLLDERLRASGLAGAVGLMTSRRLDAYADVTSEWAGASARCIATVGLGNALRVGDPPGVGGHIGTINLLCRVSVPLSEEALLETAAVAVEARTLAVVATGVTSTRTGAPATGTGTDCVVVASPIAPRRGASFAGKHTVIGHLVGASVEKAVSDAAATWEEERREGARSCS